MEVKKRHSPEEVIMKLEEANLRIIAGQRIAQVCKVLEISEATFHRWRQQYGGMKIQGAKRLKVLEKENAKLKKIVADLILDREMMKPLASGDI